MVFQAWKVEPSWKFLQSVDKEINVLHPVKNMELDKHLFKSPIYTSLISFCFSQLFSRLLSFTTQSPLGWFMKNCGVCSLLTLTGRVNIYSVPWCDWCSKTFGKERYHLCDPGGGKKSTRWYRHCGNFPAKCEKLAHFCLFVMVWRGAKEYTVCVNLSDKNWAGGLGEAD